MVIDIRRAEKYNVSHMENAVNISFNELYLFPDRYLDKNKQYYLYCDTGSRSKVLVKHLNDKGYNCVNIDGGYNKIMLGK